MAENYQQTIQRMRQERAQRERVERLNEISREHAEYQQLRDEAAQHGDLDGFEIFDKDCERLEQEWAQTQPQGGLSEAKAQWIAQHRSLIDRYGARGINALGMAHQYATAPRDPGNSGNRNQGMGLQEDTPEYFKAVEGLLEMYGKQAAGISFEPNEALSADEVCKMTGLQPKEYNRQARRMYQSGHDLGTLYGNQFKRNIG
jgi:hypothetical protein